MFSAHINEEEKQSLKQDSPYNKVQQQQVPPVTFSFENLSYCVTSEKKNKQLLYNVSGVVKPGSVLAIMGPSGAGKTTLLDILAGRATKGTITQGTIKINGSPVRSSESFQYLKRISGYVMQDDALIAALTVKETLNYVAMLKLHKLSKKEREERVNNILVQLHLWEVRDRLIGSQFERGISGGERRRVGIGIELITAPSILFLDEPTSGLDGSSAYCVMKSIISLAESGCSIICTIHQPRANIFSLFDQLLLLTGGKTCFYGPAKESIGYFESLGCSYDAFDSASDWILDLVTNRTEGEDDEFQPQRKRLEIDFPGEFQKSNYHQICNNDIQEINTQKVVELKKIGKYASPIYWQIYVLIARTFKNYFRNPGILWIRLFQAIFMAFLVGSIFWQVADDTTGIKTRTSAIFFIVTYQVLSSFASLPFLIEERGRFNREIQSNIYSTFSYFVAEFISIIPLLIVFSMTFGIVTYLLVGFQFIVSKVLFFLLTVCLLCIIGDALCKSISALVSTFSIANALASIFLTFFMLFSGFFLPVSSLPIIWKWAPYISLFKYAFDALMSNEFQGLDLPCINGSLPTPCPPNSSVSGTNVLNYLDIPYEYMWGDIAVLGLIFFGFKIFQFIFLKFLNKEKR